MKESRITSEKQNLCPLCRVPLPDNVIKLIFKTLNHL